MSIMHRKPWPKVSRVTRSWAERNREFVGAAVVMLGVIGIVCTLIVLARFAD